MCTIPGLQICKISPCCAFSFFLLSLLIFHLKILPICYRPAILWESNTYCIQYIRIYHECEGRIEKSVPRIAVWHHEPCRVMTNGDCEGRIFLSYPHTSSGFFFLLTTVFIDSFILYLFIYFKISFQKPLNTLRCNFTWWRYLTSWVR